ncbi:hypothetical protein Tco_0862934 [Tanacetum coccineum]
MIGITQDSNRNSPIFRSCRLPPTIYERFLQDCQACDEADSEECKVGDAQLIGPEIVGETTEKIIQIKHHIQDSCDRQKSYADKRRKPLEFQVGDKVMLKVSPWKGVIHFGKRGKLNPRYIGPFKILAKVGTVAYRLELPEQLSRVHSTFHVSNLKKCLSDEPLSIPLDEIYIDEKLNFIEEPVEIMDREVKRLKQSRIPIVKVRWNSRRGPEYTWEREDQMQKKNNSLDNLHTEVVHLSATLNQAAILEAERDEEILRLKTTPSEFSVQGELLSLAASAEFERGLSMHRTKDEFAAVLKLSFESTVTPASKSLELSANFDLTTSVFAFEHNEEMVSAEVDGSDPKMTDDTITAKSGHAFVQGMSVLLDDVVELVGVGSGRVSSGPNDVVVALSASEKGDGLTPSSVVGEKAVVNPSGV